MKYNFIDTIDRKKQGSVKWNMMYEISDGVKEGIIPFSVADTEFITAPEIKEGLCEYIHNSILGYATAYDDYHQSMINWYKRRHDWELVPKWIVNTPGVVTAIFNAIDTFTEEGDGIIIFRPVYYPFTLAIENTGRKITNVPLINEDGYYTIDFEGFERACKDSKNKMVIISNPHNPVGRVWKKEELEKLVKIAKKHKIYMVSDEIWNDLIMPGYKHTPTALIDQEYNKYLITCTAASKTFNIAGLQLSAIVITDEDTRNKYMEKLELTHRDKLNCLGYKAAEVAYNSCENWLEELIIQLEKNKIIVEEFLKEHLPKAKLSPIEGTYLAWIDLTYTGKSNEELEKLMIKNDLFFDEGYIFGDEGSGYERINLGCPESILKKALERLKNALNN